MVPVQGDLIQPQQKLIYTYTNTEVAGEGTKVSVNTILVPQSSDKVRY